MLEDGPGSPPLGAPDELVPAQDNIVRVAVPEAQKRATGRIVDGPRCPPAAGFDPDGPEMPGDGLVDRPGRAPNSGARRDACSG